VLNSDSEKFQEEYSS